MGLSDTMGAVSSFFQRDSRYTPLPTNAPTKQQQAEARDRRRRNVKLAAVALMLMVFGYLAVAFLYVFQHAPLSPKANLLVDNPTPGNVTPLAGAINAALLSLTRGASTRPTSRFHQRLTPLFRRAAS